MWKNDLRPKKKQKTNKYERAERRDRTERRLMHEYNIALIKFKLRWPKTNYNDGNMVFTANDTIRAVFTKEGFKVV